eukprot:m.80247 g.80247  ORF g.80247 m.80247 type:complete len:301 (-) comp9337_c0_seq1:226-1128(-)
MAGMTWAGLFKHWRWLVQPRGDRTTIVAGGTCIACRVLWDVTQRSISTRRGVHGNVLIDRWRKVGVNVLKRVQSLGVNHFRYGIIKRSSRAGDRIQVTMVAPREHIEESMKRLMGINRPRLHPSCVNGAVGVSSDINIDRRGRQHYRSGTGRRLTTSSRLAAARATTPRDWGSTHYATPLVTILQEQCGWSHNQRFRHRLALAWTWFGLWRCWVCTPGCCSCRSDSSRRCRCLVTGMDREGWRWRVGSSRSIVGGARDAFTERKERVNLLVGHVAHRIHWSGGSSATVSCVNASLASGDL